MVLVRRQIDGSAAAWALAAAGAAALAAGAVLGSIRVGSGDERCGSVFDVDLFTACDSRLGTRNVLVWNAAAMGAFLLALGCAWLVRGRPLRWPATTSLAVVGIALAAWAPHVWREAVLAGAGY